LERAAGGDTEPRSLAAPVWGKSFHHRRSPQDQWGLLHRGRRLTAIFQFPWIHRPLYADSIQPFARHAERADFDRDRKIEVGLAFRAERTECSWPPIADRTIPVRSRLVRYGR